MDGSIAENNLETTSGCDVAAKGTRTGFIIC